MQSLNPYVVGNSVGGSPAFVGRESILQSVHSILPNPKENAVLLHGQRRIGKTSILAELQTRLEQEGSCCPIMFDLLGKARWSADQIIRELANKISETVGEQPPQLGDNPKIHFQKHWLPKILEDIDKPLILLFDEFDSLDDNMSQQTKTETEFFSYLHELMQVSEKNLNFVFVIGCKIDDLTQIAAALFKGVCRVVPVSLLSPEDTCKLITLSEINQSLRWSTRAKKAIWQLTQGHPYLTQQICYCVWENLCQDQENKSPLEALPKHIEQAMPAVLERSQGAINWLWGGLEAAQKVFVSVVAQACEKNRNKVATKKQLDHLLSDIGIKISVPSLDSAPKFLQNNWDLICERRGSYASKIALLQRLFTKYKPLHSVKYAFKVPLLQRLFATHKPLHSLKNELSRLEPEADQYYQQAIQLHTDQESDKALDILARVLRLNPNHIEAYQLQANILWDLGRLEEAINPLKKFFNDHPHEARPLLTQTLWNRAQSSKREAEQLQFYEDILHYDADHVDARKKIQMVWKQRAERYLRDEDCKSAITAYKEAQKMGLKGNKVRETQIKCVKTKYSKGVFKLVVFLGIIGCSYLLDNVLQVSPRWWLWGPMLGLGGVFLIEKVLSKQPPEKF